MRFEGKPPPSAADVHETLPDKVTADSPEQSRINRLFTAPIEEVTDAPKAANDNSVEPKQSYSTSGKVTQEGVQPTSNGLDTDYGQAAPVASETNKEMAPTVNLGNEMWEDPTDTAVAELNNTAVKEREVVPQVPLAERRRPDAIQEEVNPAIQPDTASVQENEKTSDESRLETAAYKAGKKTGELYRVGKEALGNAADKVADTLDPAYGVNGPQEAQKSSLEDVKLHNENAAWRERAQLKAEVREKEKAYHEAIVAVSEKRGRVRKWLGLHPRADALEAGTTKQHKEYVEASAKYAEMVHGAASARLHERHEKEVKQSDLPQGDTAESQMLRGQAYEANHSSLQEKRAGLRNGIFNRVYLNPARERLRVQQEEAFSPLKWGVLKQAKKILAKQERNNPENYGKVKKYGLIIGSSALLGGMAFATGGVSVLPSAAALFTSLGIGSAFKKRLENQSGAIHEITAKDQISFDAEDVEAMSKEMIGAVEAEARTKKIKKRLQTTGAIAAGGIAGATLPNPFDGMGSEAIAAPPTIESGEPTLGAAHGAEADARLTPEIEGSNATRLIPDPTSILTPEAQAANDSLLGNPTPAVEVAAGPASESIVETAVPAAVEESVVEAPAAETSEVEARPTFRPESAGVEITPENDALAEDSGLAPEPDPIERVSGASDSYTLNKGDNLWNILAGKIDTAFRLPDEVLSLPEVSDTPGVADRHEFMAEFTNYLEQPNNTEMREAIFKSDNADLEVLLESQNIDPNLLTQAAKDFALNHWNK